MKKGFKKFTAILLAGLVACAALTACGDEDQVKVSADDPMSPGEIHNALKKSSDYTVTVNGGEDINRIAKKDGTLFYRADQGNVTGEWYYDFTDSSTFQLYTLKNGAWKKMEYELNEHSSAYGFVQHIFPVDDLDSLFNDAHYTSAGNGSYTMTAEGLAAVNQDYDSITISSSGLIYTINIDFWIITIDFSDITLTLPTVTE